MLYGDRSLGFKFQKSGRHDYAINNRLGRLEEASGYPMRRPGTPPRGWERRECRMLRHRVVLAKGLFILAPWAESHGSRGL